MKKCRRNKTRAADVLFLTKHEKQFNILKIHPRIMSRSSEDRQSRREAERRYGPVKRRINGWLLFGVIVLIVLLFIWLTFADFSGDTDVAAFIPGLL